MSTPLLNYRYRVIKSLAEGGFGKTFLAEDTQMPSRRQCVIKQLKPVSDRPNIIQLVQQRFAREAAVLETVGKGHSQIPDLYAYFEEQGQFYLVQEWVDGKPLLAHASEVWSESRVVELLASALGAIAHIHSRDIIHRDIKPDNIILRKSDQQPCLIDFGAVKELMSTVVGSSGSMKSSLVIGTPGFMPPEQAAGRPTFASDLYSLGMTAIYLLTGRSPAELPTNSQTGEVLWRQYAPNLSDRLANVLSRSVHPFAQNRYPTAADMQAALPPSTLPETTPSADISTISTVVVDGHQQETTLPPTSTSSTPELLTNPYYSLVPAAAKSPLSLPWKRVGLAVGAIAVGTGIFMGIKPQLSFQSRASDAELSTFQSQISTLEETLQTDPNDVSAQISLATARADIGQYDQALSQLDAVLAKDASNVDARLARAKVKMTVGDYKEVVEALSDPIEQGQQRADLFIERGNAYYELGQYDQSIDDYRSALRLDPDNGQAYKEWAGVNFVQGNAQEALQNLDLAVKNDPTISAYANRGSRRAELGDKLGAIADWTKGSAMPARTADEFASRGYIKSRLANKNGAVDDYNQALIINPNHVRSLTNRAALFYEQGEKEQALGVLEKALAINPNSLVALILQGEIRSFSTPTDWEGSIASYSKALEVNPNDPDVLNNRCASYFSVDQLDLALADCDRGLKNNPRSPALYVSRGNIRLRQENYEGAIQDYSRTIELGDEVGGDPNRQSTAYSNRASALMGVQDLNGALTDLNKALELRPNDPVELFKRGILKHTFEDEAGAREDLLKSAELYLKEGRTDSHQNVISMMEQLEL